MAGAMVRVAFDWVLAAGLAAAGAGVAAQPAIAVPAADAPQVAEAAAAGAAELTHMADVRLHFTQEDGPDSGHVRILLVPETRPLTLLEARSAAQQAFLEALGRPGLGDNLSRITVVVRLVPASHPDSVPAEQTVVFLHKGGRDWSVLAGE